MKLIYRDDSHSIDCSMIILSVAIWSVHDLFFRKSAFSSRNFSSSVPFILSNSMRVKTLLRTDRCVIPLQFLHIRKSPFFWQFHKVSIFPLFWDFLLFPDLLE